QAASPAAWSWSILTTALAPASIRGVVFRPTGDAAVAVSGSGLMRWERGAWTPVSLPGHVPRASVRGVRWLHDGSILLFGEGGLVGSICGGHLAAIAPLPNGGAVTVGVGGHALSLNAKLEAQLEAVQTTRDLLSLATTDDGQAWAGSAQARLMRRSTLATPGWV